MQGLIFVVNFFQTVGVYLTWWVLNVKARGPIKFCRIPIISDMIKLG